MFASVMIARAWSIMYQMTSAKLPLAKEMGELDFGLVAADKSLPRRLVSRNVLDRQRVVRR